MGKPVLVVVDDEEASRQALARELEARYGTHYRIVSSVSPDEALAGLEQLRAEGADVPLVLADQWMPGMTGAQLLGRVRELHPTARRVLLVSWGDQSAAIPGAAALGQIDFFVFKPSWAPDEQFHRAVTESLEAWWRLRGGQFATVTVIGEEPSGRVHEIRDLLTRNNIPFGFTRADSPEGRAGLQRLGVPGASGPVVALFTGEVLVDPTNAQVAEAFGADVRPPAASYDVVIVGAGPAGLAAAVYGASEGLRTALLEREAAGGQAGTSSLIRNYLGFPYGVSGVELAQRAYQQAWTFGTHFVYGNPATSLAADGDMRIIGLADGTTVASRAVIIATGVSYRRLDAPGLDALAGAGVFYGAATAEAQALAGKRVFVVGGGNSAGQAALHLAKYARQVSILIRSNALAASMSRYLIREIEAAPTIDVRYRTEVAHGAGGGRLEQLRLRHRDTGECRTEPADGLFVLIGAEPFTDWLPETVSRDQWGFVLTGPDLATSWTQPREPYLLESSTPGVFAVGDVRHGSVKRVASAVGDGSIAIRLVHEYLAQAPVPGLGIRRHPAQPHLCGIPVVRTTAMWHRRGSARAPGRPGAGRMSAAGPVGRELRAKRAASTRRPPPQLIGCRPNPEPPEPGAARTGGGRRGAWHLTWPRRSATAMSERDDQPPRTHFARPDFDPNRLRRPAQHGVSRGSSDC